MHFSLRIGETTQIPHPETGEPITVRVDAIENGKAVLTVLPPPGMSVAKVGAPPPTLH